MTLVALTVTPQQQSSRAKRADVDDHGASWLVRGTLRFEAQLSRWDRHLADSSSLSPGLGGPWPPGPRSVPVLSPSMLSLQSGSPVTLRIQRTQLPEGVTPLGRQPLTFAVTSPPTLSGTVPGAAPPGDTGRAQESKSSSQGMAGVEQTSLPRCPLPTLETQEVEQVRAHHPSSCRLHGINESVAKHSEWVVAT